MPKFLIDKLGRLGAWLLAVAIVLAVLVGGYYAVKRFFTAGLVAQSKIDQGQSGAFHNSAAEAINAQGAVNQNAVASETLSRTNEEEIRHAKGADARLDPELDAALVRAFCRRAASRNDPKCRVQQPHP